ncbi:MAG: uroporphyrinogen decarboxylase family protein [Candidatus Aminicenantaceae bacterium]
MTSRDRVLRALNYQETDRVPIDLSGHRSSGIAALAYPKLRAFLDLPPRPVRVYDMVQQLAVVDEDVLDRFGVDTIEMGRAFLLRDEDWKEWTLPDGSPCLIPGFINVERRGRDWVVLSDKGQELGLQKPGCLYFEQTHFPLMERGIAGDDFSDLEDILSDTIWTGVVHPGAHLDLDDAGLAEMAQAARDLRSKTDRAIIGLFGGNLFEVPQMLYRMDNYLLYLGMYPDDVLRLSHSLCEIYLKNLQKWLGSVGPYIDIVQFGDDLGGQGGPLLSPEMYRRFYKPFHTLLWSRAKELAEVKVMLHCCGGVRELLPDLIDAGLEAINPVQVNTRGMEAAGLKRDFGRDITFWGGGCDTRDVLPHGTPEEVGRHVAEQVRVLRPGGGFVFQQVHNILADVPPVNIAAMFEAVHQA